MMIAYLEPVRTTSTVALQRAVTGFRCREGKMPKWAVAGEGVTLPSDEVLRFGLSVRPSVEARPGHVLVGLDVEREQND